VTTGILAPGHKSLVTPVLLQLQFGVIGKQDLLAGAVVAQGPEGTLSWKTAEIGINQEAVNVLKWEK
jgi:hypothetical protein